MRKILFFTLAIVGLAATNVRAESYLFSATDSGGTGAAAINFQYVGNQVIATIDNTSPILLDDGSGDNAPGITGFGFDFLPDTLAFDSWSLEAFGVDEFGNLVAPAIKIDDEVGGTADWTLTQNGNFGGPWTFDYVPKVDGGIQGALYNPDAVGSSALAAQPNYFTTAVLTLTFAPGDTVEGLNLGTQNNPFVRMQNVGKNGAGSLKITGTPGGGPDPGPNPVPEPSSMVLLGIGLAGLAGYGWRRKRRSAA